MNRNPVIGLVLGMLLLGLVATAPVAAAASGDLQCTGVLTGVTARNVTVPAGAACVLKNSQVTGNVSALAGSYLQSIHSQIGGDVAGIGAQTLFVEGGSTVRGSLRAGGVAQIFLFASRVRKDVKINATDQVFICGSTVERGNLEVTRSGRDILIGDPRSGGCAGNSVLRGDMTVRQNKTDVELVISGNRLPRGNLTVSGNTGTSTKVVSGNSGGARIACKANGQYFKASKNLRWKRGACVTASARA